RGPQSPCMELRVGPAFRRDNDRGKPPERWQDGLFPLGDLPLVEGTGIAGDDRLHHWMLRLVCLQQSMALETRSPGPPGDLAEKLECPLRRTWIAIGKPEVRIDDAHQRHQREVVTLRHQ